MDLDEAKQKLAKGGYVIENENDLVNDYGPYGKRLDLTIKANVNAFDNGTVNVQGKDKERVEACLAGSTSTGSNVAPASRESSDLNTKIFVVYGRDDNAKGQLAGLLRKWNLTPLLLDEFPPEGRTIIEQLEEYTSQAKFAIVLVTPDDEGHEAGCPDKKTFRPRQNVVLEFGMMIAKMGRENVVILLKDSEPSLEMPSDIHDLLHIRFKNDVEEDAKVPLFKALNKAGYFIDASKL